MSIFLTGREHNELVAQLEQDHPALNRFWAALRRRVQERIEQPGLVGRTDDTDWWYVTAEYLSDAAMVYAIEKDEETSHWLRNVSLGIARQSESDWIGPRFRDHTKIPPVGNLETAHLCWGLSIVYDLAGEIFAGPEREEIVSVLTKRGIPLCRRWLEQNTHLANWRGVMMSGMAIATVVTGNAGPVEEAVKEFNICSQAFQSDGSYAESLQYANYLAYALMISYEAIARSCPDRAADLDLSAYVRSMDWVVSSMFYAKPLSGWGVEPRPCAANFNDSALLFRPSADLLLHIAARCNETMPRQAGLARWLFDQYYLPVPEQGPHSLATFGMRNDWGFLTLPLLLQHTEAVTPEDAELPVVSAFSNGNVFVRDTWQGKTILAIQGGSEELHAPGHLHGDLNSFILVHNREHLLADPGHSCYRNLIHGLESSSMTHNTCTFLVGRHELELQEDLAKLRLLEQQNVPARRELKNGKPGSVVQGRGTRLLCKRIQEVTAIGSEAHELYGMPIREYSRFWLLAGSHILFVIDRIRSSKPVLPVWNWLANNRDGCTGVEAASTDQLLISRKEAGLKVVHLGDARLHGPVYAYVHDAYHTEPNQLGEGKPGSGLLYRWIAGGSLDFCLTVHAFAFDEVRKIHSWDLNKSDGKYQWSNLQETWTLNVKAERPLSLEIANQKQKQWTLKEIKKGSGFKFKRST